MRFRLNPFIGVRGQRSIVSKLVGLEPLERRQLFATIIVDSTADVNSPFNGDTTLPDAIFKANSTPGADTIVLPTRETFVLDHVHNINWGASGLESIASDITIEGNGATIMRSDAPGTPDFRIFYVMSEDRVSAFLGPGAPVTTPHLTLKNLTLLNGSSKGGGGGPGGGGGAGLGGAIYNQSLLTLDKVLIANSSAKGGFGGVRSTALGDGGGFAGPNGGGLHATSESIGNGQTGSFGGGGGKGSTGKGGNGQFAAGGGSTNSSNPDNRGIGGFAAGNGNISAGAGGGGAGLGGAIFNEAGSVLINNSTLYNNSAAGGSGHDAGHGFGGAIFNLNGSLTLTSATISGNAAEAGRGVFLASAVDSSGTAGTARMSATNTLFSQADITASDLAQSGTVQITGSHNMVRNSTAATPAGFSFSDSDPKLGPLADNGGFSKTLALLSGSPAINSGINNDVPTGTTDQRGGGNLRIRGGIVDVGAFESNGESSVASFVSINDGSVIEGNSGIRYMRFTVTRSGDLSGSGSVEYQTGPLGAEYPSDFDFMTGTLFFVAGEASRQVEVVIHGDTLPEPDEQFRVFLFEPRAVTITDAEGIGTIFNDDGDVAAQLTVTDMFKSEGNIGTSPLLFTVQLSRAVDTTVTVAYRTRNKTAGEGDYGPTSGTLTFAPGETSKQVGVSIKGDTKVESDEQFIFELSSPTNATIAGGQAFGTIVNDDASGAVPAISINDLDGPEGNSGTSQFIFTLTLDRPSTQTVSVAYRTRNQTAGEGDYGVTSGTITFAPGQTSRSIAITIKGDTKVEGTETFAIDLSSAVNATIADSIGVGTIRNDD